MKYGLTDEKFPSVGPLITGGRKHATGPHAGAKAIA